MSWKGGMSKIMATVDVIPLCIPLAKKNFSMTAKNIVLIAEALENN